MYLFHIFLKNSLPRITVLEKERNQVVSMFGFKDYLYLASRGMQHTEYTHHS
jgi:hypothetical protein